MTAREVPGRPRSFLTTRLIEYWDWSLREGVPSVAFPWKKTFFDKLTISSHLAESRRVNYISPKVLSCSGLHAPKRQAELGFFFNSLP